MTINRGEKVAFVCKNGEGKKYGTYDRLTYGEMYKIVIRSLGLSFKPQQL